MFRPALNRLALAACASLVPGLAFAHSGLGQVVGFAEGLAHPLSGLDHVLAMVMVGVLAWQCGRRAAWLLPASFLAVMALGAGLGMAGLGLPLVEAGIALSVIALGGAIAFGLRPPLALGAALVGLFALFHGQAHGAGMPETAQGLAYAAGFLVATAGLLGTGLGLGRAIGGQQGRAALRLAGGTAAVAGVALLAGLA
ncbi:urease accessory protein [Humitalea rosea]|uniref:Urease accessory protein n=1 Tax=Humitalea rosea TaxID=990373 RepID=A0A2W7IIX1_9PROT|nr:HupE/UreJ family protein [Humitalea rosea]PZW46830.1 urease accessory protein [Humitalea rosea]